MTQSRHSGMLRRLLWKELREDWLVILIATLAPVLAFPAAARSAQPWRDLYDFIASLASPLAVMLWAAWKAGSGKNDAKTPLANLPVGVSAQWCVSVLTPWVVAGLLGAVYGAMDSCLVRWAHLGPAALAGALYMMAGFAGCYLLSAAISVWFAIIAGFVWMMCGILGVQQIGYYNGYPMPIRDTIGLLLQCAVGSATSLVLYLALSRINRLRLAQVLSVTLMAAVILGPDAWQAFCYAQQPQYDFSDQLCSLDGSLSVSADKIGLSNALFRLSDRRTGQIKATVFYPVARPIDLLGRDRVYMAQQLPSDDAVKVLEWSIDRHPITGHIVDTHLHEVATVPAGRGALQDTKVADSSFRGSSIGSACPDGHYLLVYLRSSIGDGTDVWIVDLRKHESTLALPNTLQWIHSDRPNVSWMGDRVALSCPRFLRAVDLVTMREVPSQLISQSEGDEK